MSREQYQKYLEILEVRPDASLAEIKKSYHHLKKLYASDSIVISPIAEEFTEEKRRETLQQIEDAYNNLLSLLEMEDKKILKKEQKIQIVTDKTEREEKPIPRIEMMVKQTGSILKADGLQKSFNGRQVVKGLNIQVRSGEIIGLLGRNGAGKTTTFLMIAGLLKPDKGGLYLDDLNISTFSTHIRAKRGITYLPQENSVFLKTTVENNLKMVWEMMGNKRNERKRVARQLLEELGLASLSQQMAFSLSGGERRKLEICRALLLDPQFLLLDEPFTGIDPLTIIDLQKILIKLRNSGIGVVMSDHNVRDTFRITDRAYVIDEGEILVEGNPHEIATSKLAREHFLGENFKLGEEVTYSS